MSGEFRDKLRSLHFSVRAPTHKQTVEGDLREGTVVTESDERQDVQVFIPPVTVEAEAKQLGEMQAEAAETAKEDDA